MARFRLCILLGVLLGVEPSLAGIGSGNAGTSDGVPARRAARGDTSRVTGLDAPWDSPSPWSRREARSRRWGDLRAAPPSSSSPTARWWSEARAAGGPVADPNLWGANGNVLDIARSGNTLYIAGSFRSVGENSGGFVPLDAHAGEPLRPFPKVAGSVYAIVPDGSEGWYVGGEFTAIGGQPRSSLAQIRADGSVTDWDPGVTGSPGYIQPPAVYAITVCGDRVFIGGGFREVGGMPHENLGCVDSRTGAVLDWNLDTDVSGEVYTLAASDSTVFVGGYFFRVGGQPRSCLAAVDAMTGTVQPWQADAGGAVWSLLVRGDSVFVGGEFGRIAGGSRSLLAALDIHTARLLPFDGRGNGIYLDYVPRARVTALVLAGDTLYAAGNFTQIGGQPRHSVAALSAITGDALSWAAPQIGPTPDGFPPPLCQAIAVSGGVVYVGGWFEGFGTDSRPFVAALSSDTGALTGWNPKPDLTVYALAARGDTVYVGGIFSSVGEWRHRAGLAAIDLATGTVKPWNPNPDGIICTAVAVRGDRVFVSGDFASIGGDPQPRDYFAALDTINGEVTDWNPEGNLLAIRFLVVGDTLYAGGEFTQFGGQARNHLAAFDATTGGVLPWDPNANLPVFALERRGNTIYVGGLFDQVGGQARRGIAAVDAATGALLPWNPDTDNSTVQAMLVSGNTVYVGGGFGQIGGQPRNALAAVDATTGEALPWYPTMSGWGTPSRVRALALADSTLYVGGSFGTIGGQPRICLAAVDTSTGLATDWDPGTDGLVWSLAAYGNTVYAGGGFTRAGGYPAAGLAAFSITPPVPPTPSVSRVTIARVTPNPTITTASVRYALPAAGRVTLAVFDMQGRRIASLLNHQQQDAGWHDEPVRVDGWPTGVYFCRLEAGGASATRRFVVVR